MAMYPTPFITKEGAECSWAAQGLTEAEANRVATVLAKAVIKTRVGEYTLNGKKQYEVILIIGQKED